MGFGLILLAVAGLFLANSAWVKLLSAIVILAAIVLFVWEWITDGFEPHHGIFLFSMALVAVIANGIQKSIDPKPKETQNS